MIMRPRRGRRAAASEVEEPGAGPLFELQRRHDALCAELIEVEERLRRLRSAAELCVHCGGEGERWVRGGLYGEMQRRPCVCQGAGVATSPAESGE